MHPQKKRLTVAVKRRVMRNKIQKKCRSNGLNGPRSIPNQMTDDRTKEMLKEDILKLTLDLLSNDLCRAVARTITLRLYV